MCRLLFFCLLFFTIHIEFCIAQLSNPNCIWIQTGVTRFIPGENYIDAGSLRIEGIYPKKNDSTGVSGLSYNLETNEVIITYNPHYKHSLPDSLLICFQQFPFHFSKSYFHRSQQAYDSGVYKNIYQELTYENDSRKKKKEAIFQMPGIRKQGSLTRGISFGNNQDVALNAALNLHLEGKLTNDIEIEAVFSDQNLPFQPEGNTRQIRDIDKVYLALKHKYGKLEAGDVILKNGKSSYLKYNKQVLGAMLSLNKTDTIAKKAYQSQIGLAVAKGKFSSTSINVQEGVSGPYQIQGPGNERFIIIVAGSERVYLDEIQLQRGINYDYTIDYNNAEITFTSKRIITRYSRVRIEFEYTLQHYSRLSTIVSHKQQEGNLHFFADYYREADGKNNPLTFNLNTETYEALAIAGDSTENIFYRTNPDTIAQYDLNNILYTKKDSIYKNETYTIFIRASEQDYPLFAPNFIYAGKGKGNYVLGNARNNGREYFWVAPENGVPTGEYEPGNIITAPDSKKMLSLGGHFELGKNEFVYAETAFSNEDRNLLSDLNDENNTGQAIKIGYQNKGKALSFSRSYLLQAAFNIERITENFRQIDRFRPVSFDRDWGIFQNTQVAEKDQIIQTSLGLVKDKKNAISYQIAFRKKGEGLQGIQHKTNLRQQLWKFDVKGTV
ncbi:MAG: hypothetical protein AAGI07_10965, partial [Bacteroidota bacterium]